MTTPHVHRDLIIAWANGETIQAHCPRGGDGWVDCYPNAPAWFPDAAYRIKPKPVTVRYRVALMENGDSGWASAASSNGDAAFAEKQIGFVRWDTDWKEVQV